MLDKNQLLLELKNFYGSETFYKNPLFPMFRYTEGVRFVAVNAGAYWLLNEVFGHQFIEPFKDEPFQVWKLKVAENHTATITVEDGNYKILKIIKLEFTDFPLDDFTLWLTDNTLLLPSEY